MMLSDLHVNLPIIGERTLKWPDDDVYMRRWVHLIDQVDEVVGLTNGRDVCVQAGGACGLWPLALSQYFQTVYTFEPHIPNFKALTYNCLDATNVIAMNAAIGNRHGTVGIKWDRGHEQNLGAQYISASGAIPILTVDSLRLDRLDLLYLDLEGSEGAAIQGAWEAIEKHRPVVVYEDREHCKRFGFTRKQIAGWFTDIGYKKVSTLSRDDDAVMVP